MRTKYSKMLVTLSILLGLVGGGLMSTGTASAIPHLQIIEADLAKAKCAPSGAQTSKFELSYVWSPESDVITVHLSDGEVLTVRRTPTEDPSRSIYVVNSPKQVVKAQAMVQLSWHRDELHRFDQLEKPCPAPAKPSWCRVAARVVTYFRLPPWWLPPVCR